MKRMLWWLIAGTKGGVNRARIIKILHERPYNANQL
ncbi:MAG TPA: ArsR family transcriptional regulator, partial [Methanosarcinales archaeon]|nr:ArsR family transcriptional regulator [Methanosarcinales archaeon]